MYIIILLTFLTNKGHPPPKQAEGRPDAEDQEQSAPDEQEPHVELVIEEEIREKQDAQDDAREGGDARRVAGQVAQATEERFPNILEDKCRGSHGLWWNLPS